MTRPSGRTSSQRCCASPRDRGRRGRGHDGHGNNWPCRDGDAGAALLGPIGAAVDWGQEFPRPETRAMKMTTEEAFVKVLQMHGIASNMPLASSDRPSCRFPTCFPGPASISGTARTKARADDGRWLYPRLRKDVHDDRAERPGITNFVTAVKTAYWNHTPLLLVTPQAANKTIGQGGFQEVEQMALFKDMVAYQEEVRDPSRIAEVLNRVIINARRASAPAQINVPATTSRKSSISTCRGSWSSNAPRGRGCDRGSGGPAVEGALPGHSERRRRGAGRRDPGQHETGRTAGCPGLRWLPAQ